MEEAYAPGSIDHYAHSRSLAHRRWVAEEVGAERSMEEVRYQPLYCMKISDIVEIWFEAAKKKTCELRY